MLNNKTKVSNRVEYMVRYVGFIGIMWRNCLYNIIVLIYGRIPDVNVRYYYLGWMGNNKTKVSKGVGIGWINM
jgi:hypothetical protein